MRRGFLTRLHSHVIVVVVTGDGTLSAGDDEAAARLRLDAPGIGERAPARLKPGEAMRVTRNDDAVLIDFKSLWLIDDGRHFDGSASPLIPGAKRRTVAEIVEQRPAAMRLLVKPRTRL